MGLPRPKTQEELDLADWLDVKRTEVTLKHRIAARREKEAILEQAREAVDAGKALKAITSEASDV